MWKGENIMFFCHLCVGEGRSPFSLVLVTTISSTESDKKYTIFEMSQEPEVGRNRPMGEPVPVTTG